METLFYKKAYSMKHTRLIKTLLLMIALPLVLASQTSAQAPWKEHAAKDIRPEKTDKASDQLIDNFLTVSGGKQAHVNLLNVVATGTIEEAGRIRQFKLIETQDGKRKITYTWRHLGREYKEIYAFDGINAWTQKAQPKNEPARNYSGRMAEHFKSQYWLLKPMVLPLKAPFVFRYQGIEKVSGRPAYVIVGYGKKNERSWFYFDKEKFLMTRWGGLGLIASIEEYLDYSATQFTQVNGVLLPKEINLLAEGKPFGKLTFDNIKANMDIDTKLFNIPVQTSPMLRQQTQR